MGILDFLSGQFIDVIHWVDNTRDTMAGGSNVKAMKSNTVPS